MTMMVHNAATNQRFAISMANHDDAAVDSLKLLWKRQKSTIGQKIREIGDDDELVELLMVNQFVIKLNWMELNEESNDGMTM